MESNFFFILYSALFMKDDSGCELQKVKDENISLWYFACKFFIFFDISEFWVSWLVSLLFVTMSFNIFYISFSNSLKKRIKFMRCLMYCSVCSKFCCKFFVYLTDLSYWLECVIIYWFAYLSSYTIY